MRSEGEEEAATKNSTHSIGKHAEQEKERKKEPTDWPTKLLLKPNGNKTEKKETNKKKHTRKLCYGNGEVRRQ